jgi:serine/threonine protein phosphatase PrpC
MRSVAVVIPLVLVTANHPDDIQEFSGNWHNPLLPDRVIDKLLDRAYQLGSPNQQADVANSFIGKPGRLPALRRSASGAIGGAGQTGGRTDSSPEILAFLSAFPSQFAGNVFPYSRVAPPPTVTTPVQSAIQRPNVVAYGIPEQKIAQDLAIEVGKQAEAHGFDTKVVGSYSYHGLDGRAKINQDRGAVVYPFAGDPQQALFAVLDGHGERGEKVSEFAINELRDRLEKYPGLVGDEAAAFETAFISTDKRLATLGRMDPTYSGSTVVTALLRGSQLWVANAGDSRCIRASKSKEGDDKIVTQDLSRDHNPDAPGEKERIERSGGYVSPPPEPGLSARVWLDKAMTQVGLAMARSIGDHAVKKVGVIATPEVQVYDLNSDDLFIILATDGIWEFISSQEAADIVWGALKSGSGASKATQLLIENAALRWRKFEGDYRDDITAIVITLPCFEHVTKKM